jgi:hypothetical protein
VVNFTPGPLDLHGKSHQYTLIKRLGGTQSEFICLAEKKTLALSGIEARIVQPIA